MFIAGIHYESLSSIVNVLMISAENFYRLLSTSLSIRICKVINEKAVVLGCGSVESLRKGSEVFKTDTRC